ncbi:unnamed protein product [Caenorhabditis brenneri]
MDTIPLHQLPDEAYVRVLKTMEIYDQLAYSLCSRHTKKATKSLNLTAEEIHLCVGGGIMFDIRLKDSIQFGSFMDHDYHFPNEEFKILEGVKVSVSDRFHSITKWKMELENFGVKDWLHHFCEVLHHPRIDELYFMSSDVNNDFIKPVQRVIKGLRLVYFGLAQQLRPGFTKKALESFQNYEELYIGRVPFDNPEVHKMIKFLIQNMSKMSIMCAERLTIDHVLLANCKILKLNRSMFFDKDLKLLLKMWIHGSNSRLKYFYTCRVSEQETRPFNEEVFFQGIKRTKIPLDSQEMYREHVYEDYFNETSLAGGYRIKRFDGTTAVVLINRFGFYFIVN